MAGIHTIPTWPGWETKEILGRGSYGAVYRIEREVLGDIEQAAIKYMSVPQGAGESDELRSTGENTESITRTFRQQVESFAEEYKLMKAAIRQLNEETP